MEATLDFVTGLLESSDRALAAFAVGAVSISTVIDFKNSALLTAGWYLTGQMVKEPMEWPAKKAVVWLLTSRIG